MSRLLFSLLGRGAQASLFLLAFGVESAEMMYNEVTVTAARSARPAADLPYTVNVVSQEEIWQQMIRSLPEALSETPGVLVQKTANGQGSPFLRGFTGYRTLTLIDGVRYNNSVYRDGPNEYFSLIDLNSLQQVELLGGPVSTLYGSDAIGGTLNLKTRKADFNQWDAGLLFFEGSQRYRYSSAENSHILRGNFQTGIGDSWGLNIGITNKNFGNVEAAEIGEQEKTGYREDSFDLRADIQVDDQWLLTLVHQQLKQDDVWRTHSTVFAKSFAGTEVGDDLRRLKDQQRKLSYLKLYGTPKGKWIESATLTLSNQQWEEDGDRVRSNGIQLFEHFDSKMGGMDLQLTSTTFLGDITYGADYYEDDVESRRVDYNADGSIDRIRIQGPVGDDAQYAQSGVYIQLEAEPAEQWLILLGSRYNIVRASIGRFEDPDTGLPASFSADWESLVSSIRVNYSLNKEWKIWGGISESFRAPNVADLSRFGKSRSSETEVAATSLEPERFTSYELGLKATTKNAELSASVYYTDIRNFIASTPTGRIRDNLIEVSKQNSASGYVSGSELAVNYFLSDDLRVFGSFTWLKGELDTFDSITSVQSQREPMSRIMPLTLLLGAHWEPVDGSWLRVAITVAGKAEELSPGDQADLQRIPPGGTPGYTLVNLQGGYRFNPHLSLTLGVENILDEAYRTHGSGSNEPGFGVNVGVEVTF